jgi:hypothetical protein
VTEAKHLVEVAAAVDAERRESETDEARSPRSAQTNDELQSSSRRSARNSHDLDAASETDDEDLRADPLPQRVPAVVKRTSAWGVTPGVVPPRGSALTRGHSASPVPGVVSPDKSAFAQSAKVVRGGCAPCARGYNPMW